ncbi:MAG: hypothetical protein ACD_62C00345G0002 [uncultured bacterium]|nr:MAG: hypothetical protein ACD_62C00345G0002 [uncultured bacterium]HLD44278.1 hypothetical protein [bacterium]
MITTTPMTVQVTPTTLPSALTQSTGTTFVPPTTQAVLLAHKGAIGRMVQTDPTALVSRLARDPIVPRSQYLRHHRTFHSPMSTFTDKLDQTQLSRVYLENQHENTLACAAIGFIAGTFCGAITGVTFDNPLLGGIVAGGSILAGLMPMAKGIIADRKTRREIQTMIDQALALDFDDIKQTATDGDLVTVCHYIIDILDLRVRDERTGYGFWNDIIHATYSLTTIMKRLADDQQTGSSDNDTHLLPLLMPKLKQLHQILSDINESAKALHYLHPQGTITSMRDVDLDNIGVAVCGALRIPDESDHIPHEKIIHALDIIQRSDQGLSAILIAFQNAQQLIVEIKSILNEHGRTISDLPDLGYAIPLLYGIRELLKIMHDKLGEQVRL